MSGRPRKPELVAVVRNALLDAATAVFARKGYAAATMNEIAAAAGYTAPAFYKYFAGKQELFEALLDRVDADVEGTLASLPPCDGLSFEERIEVLCRAGFELIDRREQTFAVLTAVHASADAMPSPQIVKREHDRARRFKKKLTTWLADAADDKQVGRVDANEAALFFHVLVQGLFMQWTAAKATEGAKKAGRFVDRVPLAVQLFLYGVSGVPAVGGRASSKRTVPARRK